MAASKMERTPAKRWFFLLGARRLTVGLSSAATSRTSAAGGSTLRGSAASASRVAVESARRSRPSQIIEYEVRFNMAGDPNTLPAVKSLEVSFGGVKRVFTFDTTGRSLGNMGWEARSWVFAAADPTITLTFSSPTTGCSTPAVDNVRTTANEIGVRGPSRCACFRVSARGEPPRRSAQTVTSKLHTLFSRTVDGPPEGGRYLRMGNCSSGQAQARGWRRPTIARIMSPSREQLVIVVIGVGDHQECLGSPCRIVETPGVLERDDAVLVACDDQQRCSNPV